MQKELVPIGSGDKAQRIYTTLLSDTGLPLGRTAIFSQNTGTHSGSLSVNLVTRSERPVSDVWAAEKVRAALRDTMPGTQLYFFIGGIVKRIQNFGATAPIDVEVLGYDLDDGSRYGTSLLTKMRGSDGRARPAAADRCPVVARGERPGAGRGGGPPEGGHAGCLRARRGADHPDQPAGQHADHPGALHRSQDRQRVLRQRTHGGCQPRARVGPGRHVHAHAQRRDRDGGQPWRASSATAVRS